MDVLQVTKVKHMIAHGGVPELVSIDQNRSVNAILILHGLPYDLTAQIVAHEATHAYIKLSESFPDHLPLMVRRCRMHLDVTPSDGRTD